MKKQTWHVRNTYKTAVKVVEAFNELYPVGSPVEYEEILDLSGKTQHKVRYPAEVRNHLGIYAEPMVFLTDKAGCVCISHITGWTNLKAKLKAVAK